MASVLQDTQLASINSTQLGLACQDDMPQPLITFHPFPKLPTEIRDLIWELALPDERRILRLNVVVKCSPPSTSRFKLFKLSKSCRHPGSKDSKSCVPQFFFECQDNPMLPTLEACHESRRVTLGRYPVRLRALQPEKEIRFGPYDVIELDVNKSIHACKQIFDSKSSGAQIPSIMDKVHTLSLSEGFGSRKIDIRKFIFHFAHDNGVKGNLWDVLFVFPGVKSILLIEDYNGATTGGRYPSDFVEFSDPNYYADYLQEDSLGALWRFARLLRVMLENVKPNGNSLKLPDIKIMYQEQARLEEVARLGNGTGDR